MVLGSQPGTTEEERTAKGEAKWGMSAEGRPGDSLWEMYKVVN